MSSLSTDACREEGAIFLTPFSSWPRRPLLPSGWIWSCTGAYMGSCYGYSSLYSHWVLSQIGKAGNSHEVSETGGEVRGGKGERKREKKPVSEHPCSTEAQHAVVENSKKILLSLPCAPSHLLWVCEPWEGGDSIRFVFSMLFPRTEHRACSVAQWIFAEVSSPMPLRRLASC